MHRVVSSVLEKKRTSITRLKLLRKMGACGRTFCDTWKEKNLDYEIETRWRQGEFYVNQRTATWKEKNLDYEIETLLYPNPPALQLRLEKKRTSITRLKRIYRLYLWMQTGTWKEKNLDYEIETQRFLAPWQLYLFLEKKRTSITRLKRKHEHWVDSDGNPAWKEKNLDYEIETALRRWIYASSPCLKRKEPRLRDWNKTPFASRTVVYLLEKKRTSITRLKLWIRLPSMSLRHPAWKEKNLDYEIETDTMIYVKLPQGARGLKRKEPRLRDWNGLPLRMRNPHLHTSLEKKRTSITRLKLCSVAGLALPKRPLEKKRTSITRLKLRYGTSCGIYGILEKKRTSITRLKLRFCILHTYSLSTWKEKNLDYEIETSSCRPRWSHFPSWKEKNLDYEIETIPFWLLIFAQIKSLKRKEPRLRDWNYRSNMCTHCCFHASLKRKEPRLRDWNLSFRRSKLTSPDRLKRKEPRLRDWNRRLGRNRPYRDPLGLKRKEPRLRDWNRVSFASVPASRLWLKKKRTSITRLKQWWHLVFLRSSERP